MNRRPWNVLALCCLMAFSLVCCGLLLYRQQERTMLGEHGENLQSVAQLKINQLLAWRQERLADVRMHASGLVRSLALEWLKAPRPEILEAIRQRLLFFQENESYSNMLVVESTGQIILSRAPQRKGSGRCIKPTADLKGLYFQAAPLSLQPNRSLVEKSDRRWCRQSHSCCSSPC